MNNAGKPSFAMDGKKRTTVLFIQQSKRWYDEERFNSHIHREKPQKMAKSFTPVDNVILVHLHMCNY